MTADYVYPEVWAERDAPPVFPEKCPVCGGVRVQGSEPGATSYSATASYFCGGKYELKPQIQTHTDKWWGKCGLAPKEKA